MITFSSKTTVTLFAMLITATACGADKQNASDTIAFYAKQGAKKPQRQLDIHTPMVAIIQHDDWVKVGLRPSGDIGWINIKQYQQAKQQYYQPSSQSFSVSITRDKNGTPTTHVTAYRNGKKLSNTAALELYQHMQQEQHASWNTWPQTLPNTVMLESFNSLHNTPPNMNISVEDIPLLQPLNIAHNTASKSVPSTAITLLTGKYSDPKHPDGTRQITVAGDQVTIVGQDKTHGSLWTVHGVVMGNALLVDFSPKGGPKNLKGTFNAKGITFEDGNKWHKINTMKA